MKKTHLCWLGLSILGVAGVFVFGPEIIKYHNYVSTPASQIETWKAEHQRLGRILPRTIENEDQRLLMIKYLARRGIYVDAGIRDEAIEHHPGLYSFFVMRLWAWEDLF